MMINPPSQVVILPCSSSTWEFKWKMFHFYRLITTLQKISSQVLFKRLTLRERETLDQREIEKEKLLTREREREKSFKIEMHFLFLLFRDENLLPPVYDSFTWTHRFLLHPSPPLPSGTILPSISLLSSPIFGSNGNPHEGGKCYVSPVVYTQFLCEWLVQSSVREGRITIPSNPRILDKKRERDDSFLKEREGEDSFLKEREMPVNLIHEGETTRSLSWSLSSPFNLNERERKNRLPGRWNLAPAPSLPAHFGSKWVSQCLGREEVSLPCTASADASQLNVSSAAFKLSFASHSLVLHPLLTLSFYIVCSLSRSTSFAHTFSRPPNLCSGLLWTHTMSWFEEWKPLSPDRTISVPVICQSSKLTDCNWFDRLTINTQLCSFIPHHVFPSNKFTCSQWIDLLPELHSIYLPSSPSS